MRGSDFFKAISLLTIFPTPVDKNPPGAGVLVFFPVVGILLGLVLSAVHLLLSNVPALLSAVILVAVWVLITRGLHIDGVSDTADALFAVCDRARRLEIMRDPHAGPMGMCAVFLVLLTKTIALGYIEGAARSWALILAALYGRWMVVPACAMFSYARTEGLGAPLIGRATRWHVAATTALVIAVSMAAHSRTLVGIVPLAILAGLGVGVVANRSIGGITGDVLGAIVELTETAVLVGCAVSG